MEDIASLREELKFAKDMIADILDMQNKEIAAIKEDIVFIRNSIGAITNTITTQQVHIESLLTALSTEERMLDAASKVLPKPKPARKKPNIKEFYIDMWMQNKAYPNKNSDGQTLFRKYFYTDEGLSAISKANLSFDDEKHTAKIAEIMWANFSTSVTSNDGNPTVKYKVLNNKYAEYIENLKD